MSGIDEQVEKSNIFPPIPRDLVKSAAWFEYRKKCSDVLRNTKNPILTLLKRMKER